MPSVNVSQSNQSTRITRCPHVILLDKSFKKILELKLKQFEYTQLQNSTKSNSVLTEITESESNSKSDSLVCLNKNNSLFNGHIDPIKCNDCECNKNLWLCLKENCYYIGCGQDSASNKHSSLHAVRSYHPLSINLTTKNVWCEQCSIRVILESNIPNINNVTEKLGKSLHNNKDLMNDSSNKIVDDYDFINFLESDSFLNEESNDDLNKFNEIGQLGLDNLGNTCYMNSALQALSNCFAFTSFFLECSSYVNHIVNLNKSLQQSSISTPLSLKYMKLMRDLWQPANRVNQKTKKIQRITSLAPVDFVNTVKLINPMFRGYQQNDSQEFLIYLMDQLHEELKRPISIPQTSINSDSDTDDTLTNTCDKDSGVSSNWTQSAQDDRDSESIDSYVTCGDDELSSDLSDNLNYSDADECFANNKSLCKKSCKNLKENVEKSKEKPVYTSIISEIFEGKLISQVRCLECNNISSTTESFFHLSIPIPSREYIQMLQNKMNRDSDQEDQSNGWIGWFFDIMKGYVWSNQIQLADCLSSFFSDDDLKDENMYSCEKCKKLTNGVKNSKILNLPEVLIIHLKRFRHDSMFSTGKINSYVSFPLDNLNMQPFVHSECKNEITQYDLSSVICHYGGSEGGHYTSYARNPFNEEWYEYDDSYCRQVESMTVQNCQGYVLFYKKKNIKTDGIKDYLREMLSSRIEENFGQSILRPYYISKQWLHKLKYFGECGAIDNSDFLCKHNFVYPKKWKIINDLTVSCTQDTWTYLIENFGLKFERNSIGFKNECNYLYPCKMCQLNDEALKQRQLYEKEEFLRLQDKWNQEQNSYNNSDQINVYAISKSWFKEWEKFVQLNECPMEHQIPGEINNYPICMPHKQKEKNKIKNHQLNPKISNFKISEEMWKFLLGIYGGGPELLISFGTKNLNGNKERTYNGKSNL